MPVAKQFSLEIKVGHQHSALVSSPTTKTGVGIETYTRYHPGSASIIQQSNSLYLDFLSLNSTFLLFRVIEKVNADPVPARVNLRDELLCGFFILVAVC
jgi:hypothetical protein